MMISSTSSSLQQQHQPLQQNQQRPLTLWDIQPMSHANASIESTTTDEVNAHRKEGLVVPNVDVTEIRQGPHSTPSGFHWSKGLYNLSWQNYVKDDDGLFRFG
jgi:hypothetical protein